MGAVFPNQSLVMLPHCAQTPTMPKCRVCTASLIRLGYFLVSPSSWPRRGCEAATPPPNPTAAVLATVRTLESQSTYVTTLDLQHHIGNLTTTSVSHVSPALFNRPSSGQMPPGEFGRGVGCRQRHRVSCMPCRLRGHARIEGSPNVVIPVLPTPLIPACTSHLRLLASKSLILFRDDSTKVQSPTVAGRIHVLSRYSACALLARCQNCPPPTALRNFFSGGAESFTTTIGRHGAGGGSREEKCQLLTRLDTCAHRLKENRL